MAELAIRSAIQSDLPYEPLRSVRPILDIIIDYVVPTAESLSIAYVADDNDYFMVLPPMSASSDVCLSFVEQKKNRRLSDKIEIGKHFLNLYGAADPILPVYYSYDSLERKIVATDRQTGLLTDWSNHRFSNDADINIVCPSSGVVYAIDYQLPLPSLIRTTRDSSSSMVLRPPADYFDFSYCSAMAGSGSQLYVLTPFAGPFEIRLTTATTAELFPLLTRIGDVRFGVFILVMLDNGLLLMNSFIGPTYDVCNWIVVDTAGVDRMQTIIPSKPPHLRMESAVQNRADPDLLYVSSAIEESATCWRPTFFEIRLSSDLWSQLRYPV